MHPRASYSDSPLSPQLHSIPDDLDITYSDGDASWSMKSQMTEEGEEIEPTKQHQQRQPMPATDLSIGEDFTRMTYLGDSTPPPVASPMGQTGAGVGGVEGEDYSSLTLDETLDALTDPSAYSIHSSSDPSDTSFLPITTTIRKFPQTAAEAASARRTALFEKDLLAYKNRVAQDKKRTPLTKEELELKQFRIGEIQKRILALRASHQQKKARVATSFQEVREAHARFVERNKEVVEQGLNVVKKLEQVQHRLHEEDLDEAEKDLKSALTLQEQRVATNLQSLPPAVIGSNPQTALRSMYTSDLPVAVLAKHRGVEGVEMKTQPAASAAVGMKDAVVELAGQRLIVKSSTPTQSPATQLRDEPLPPQPSLVHRLAEDAVQRMHSGEIVNRKAYELLQSASQFESKRQAKLQRQEEEKQGVHGLPLSASPEQQREWVNQHVFHSHAHAHSFPAPTVEDDGDAHGNNKKHSSFQRLQTAKKQFSTYVSIVQDAWEKQNTQLQVSKMKEIESRIHQINQARSKRRVEFETEKIIAMELLEKQRALLAVKDLEAGESAARGEYRRRAERILGLLETDGLWRSDQGRQAMELLKHIAMKPTVNTFWSQPPPPAMYEEMHGGVEPDPLLRGRGLLHTPPAHMRLYAESLGGKPPPRVGWTEDLWERKEWSHHSESSENDLTNRSSLPESQNSTHRSPPEKQLQHQVHRSPLRTHDAPGRGMPAAEDDRPVDHSDLDDPENDPYAQLIEPPSPESLRRARRRIQAAQRDAKLAMSARKQLSVKQEERKKREDAEALADREWLAARAERLLREKAEAEAEALGTSTDEMDTPRLAQAQRAAVARAYSPTKARYQSVAQAYEEQQRARWERLKKAHEETKDVSPARAPQYQQQQRIIVTSPQDRTSTGRLDTQRPSSLLQAPSSAQGTPQHSPLFTASTNRRALEAHTGSRLAYHNSSHSRSHQHDPESDHKHVQHDHEDLSLHSEHEHDDLSHHGGGGGHEHMTLQVSSPISQPGPSLPPMPQGGLPYLDPFSPSAASSGGGHTPVSHSYPLPLSTRAHDLSQIHERTEHESSRVGASRLGVEAEEDEMLREHSQPVSPISDHHSHHGKHPLHAQHPLSQQRSGQEVAASATVNVSGDEPGTDSSFSIGGATSMGDSTLFSASASANQSSIHASPTPADPRHTLNPPGKSNSPKGLPVSSPLNSGDAKKSSGNSPPALLAPYSVLSSRGAASVDHPQSGQQLRPELSSDEFAELFGSVSDFGEVSISATPLDTARLGATAADRRARGEAERSSEPGGYDGGVTGAIEMVTQSSHYGSGLTAHVGGMSSMRSSGADWDASNEQGDFESFAVTEGGGKFFDHQGKR